MTLEDIIEQRADLILRDLERVKNEKDQYREIVHAALDELYAALKSEKLTHKLNILTCKLDTHLLFNQITLQFHNGACVHIFGSESALANKFMIVVSSEEKFPSDTTIRRKAFGETKQALLTELAATLLGVIRDIQALK